MFFPLLSLPLFVYFHVCFDYSSKWSRVNIKCNKRSPDRVDCLCTKCLMCVFVCVRLKKREKETEKRQRRWCLLLFDEYEYSENVFRKVRQNQQPDSSISMFCLSITFGAWCWMLSFSIYGFILRYSDSEK